MFRQTSRMMYQIVVSLAIPSTAWGVTNPTMVSGDPLECCQDDGMSSQADACFAESKESASPSCCDANCSDCDMKMCESSHGNCNTTCTSECIAKTQCVSTNQGKHCLGSCSDRCCKSNNECLQGCREACLAMCRVTMRTACGNSCDDACIERCAQMCADKCAKECDQGCRASGTNTRVECSATCQSACVAGCTKSPNSCCAKDLAGCCETARTTSRFECVYTTTTCMQAHCCIARQGENMCCAGLTTARDRIRGQRVRSNSYPSDAECLYITLVECCSRSNLISNRYERGADSRTGCASTQCCCLNCP